MGRIWQNKGLSPLAIFSGLFNFPPPLSLKSKNIFICQEPRQRMLPHAWLFYFDPYWGWRTPFWTKLWVPRSGKDQVNKGLSPLAIFSGLFSFQPSLSRKCLSFDPPHFGEGASCNHFFVPMFLKPAECLVLVCSCPPNFWKKGKAACSYDQGCFWGAPWWNCHNSTYTYSPLVCDWLALKGECQYFLFGLKCLPRGEVKSNEVNEGVIVNYIQITLSKLALAS